VAYDAIGRLATGLTLFPHSPSSEISTSSKIRSVVRWKME